MCVPYPSAECLIALVSTIASACYLESSFLPPAARWADGPFLRCRSHGSFFPPLAASAWPLPCSSRVKFGVALGPDA